MLFSLSQIGMTTFKKARRGLRLNLFWLFTVVIFLSGAAHGFETQCEPDKWFKCNDGLCVRKYWRCDGEPDCMDGSDEIGCDTETLPKKNLQDVVRLIQGKPNGRLITISNIKLVQILQLESILEKCGTVF